MRTTLNHNTTCELNYKASLKITGISVMNCSRHSLSTPSDKNTPRDHNFIGVEVDGLHRKCYICSKKVGVSILTVSYLSYIVLLDMGAKVESPGVPKMWNKMPQEMHQLLYEKCTLS